MNFTLKTNISLDDLFGDKIKEREKEFMPDVTWFSSMDEELNSAQRAFRYFHLDYDRGLTSQVYSFSKWASDPLYKSIVCCN